MLLRAWKIFAAEALELRSQAFGEGQVQEALTRTDLASLCFDLDEPATPR